MQHSESIKEIATAISKFQSAISAVEKDASNPFFKSGYTSLAKLNEATREEMAKNGLSYVQGNQTGERGIAIVTLLLHTSGEWIQSTLEMPVVKQDPQSVGSAFSYGRRYALAAILGLASEDDDAESATVRKPEPSQNFTRANSQSGEVKQSSSTYSSRQFSNPRTDCKCGNFEPLQKTAQSGKKYTVCANCDGWEPKVSAVQAVQKGLTDEQLGEFAGEMFGSRPKD